MVILDLCFSRLGGMRRIVAVAGESARTAEQPPSCFSLL
jgi:hypothetical protein